jgi:hypothetical protein
MSTADPREAPYASDLLLLGQAAEALDEVHERIGPRFRRAEVRRRVRRFLEGLLAPVERKNGWQLAEALGERGPHGVQRLLAEADWDQEAVRDELRTYILAHLWEEAGILVVDETGFLKKGKKSAGVAPQYSGTAGGRANCQIGVFLFYASPKGAAFIDRELYLPGEWTEDPVRCREAGIPEAVGFATKGELAQRMLARAFAAGVRAAWVVGDTIYGSDELRTWLEGAAAALCARGGRDAPGDAPGLDGGAGAAGGSGRRAVAGGGVDAALRRRGKPGAAAVELGVAGSRCRARRTGRVALVDPDAAEPVRAE